MLYTKTRICKDHMVDSKLSRIHHLWKWEFGAMGHAALNGTINGFLDIFSLWKQIILIYF